MIYNTPRKWVKPLFVGISAAFLALAPMPAEAQRVPASDLMPPPKAAPRTPVKSERLKEAPAKELKGQASAQDGGTIHLQTYDGKGYDLRLAGLIIAPLTDAKGIAARVALDNLLTARSITCQRRDRDTDGKLLVTCTRDDSIDLGMQMLRDGVTLFTRNGNLSEEYVRAYREAEGLAQREQRGLWAGVPNLPVSGPRTITAPKTITPVIIEEPVEVAAKPEPVRKAGPIVEVAPPAPAKAATNAMQITQSPVTMAEPAQPVVTPVAATPTWTAEIPTTPDEVTNTMGFFFAASLIGTLLLGISLFDFLGRRRVRYAQEWEARQNRQIVAAALGGELAAARDVCESRANSIAHGAAPVWPRLRSYVYQTHVDRIGMLGPFLARQVATIYGQMSDYAATAKNEHEHMGAAAVTKSLNRLCGYIDVALEGLAEVEATGEMPLPAIPADYQQAQYKVTEARERQQAIAHHKAAPSHAAQHAPQYGQQHAQQRPAAARPAPAQRTAQPAAPQRAPARQAKQEYPTYGEVAAQRIMEEEVIRARAAELLKAKASPMKRRTAKPAAPQGRDAYQDTHHADLLGLEEEAVVEYADRPARGAKAKG